MGEFSWGDGKRLNEKPRLIVSNCVRYELVEHGSRAERVEGRKNRDIGKNHGGTVRTDEATCETDESIKWTGDNLLPSPSNNLISRDVSFSKVY
jgi:hypothetical protein